MKIASISDIHGNIEALEAVINDIEKENIDKIFVCGDLAVAGPNPSEVIDRLQELSGFKDMSFILGNTDEMILKANENEGLKYFPGDPAMKSSIKYCQKTLTNDQLEFLRSLPEKLVINIGNQKILLVHGSPRNISENIYPGLEEDYVKQIINGQEEDIIFCGHTHLPVIYNVGSQTVINNGSVGRPFTDNPDSCYAIVDYPDLNSKDFRVFHKYVEYDRQATADKLRKLNLEGSDKLAKIILNPSERHNTAKL